MSPPPKETFFCQKDCSTGDRPKDGPIIIPYNSSAERELNLELELDLSSSTDLHAGSS